MPPDAKANPLFMILIIIGSSSPILAAITKNVVAPLMRPMIRFHSARCPYTTHSHLTCSRRLSSLRVFA